MNVPSKMRAMTWMMWSNDPVHKFILAGSAKRALRKRKAAPRVALKRTGTRPETGRLSARKTLVWHCHRMVCIATQQESSMKLLNQTITTRVYKAYLRSRLERYRRDLQTIAVQRENDMHAERILHREVSAVRSKLQSL